MKNKTEVKVSKTNPPYIIPPRRSNRERKAPDRLVVDPSVGKRYVSESKVISGELDLDLSSEFYESCSEGEGEDVAFCVGNIRFNKN